jgi:hypothetical protein
VDLDAHLKHLPGGAPGVEQFACENAGKLRVVGLDAEDDLAAARDFVADGGVTSTVP